MDKTEKEMGADSIEKSISTITAEEEIKTTAEDGLDNEVLECETADNGQAQMSCKMSYKQYRRRHWFSLSIKRVFDFFASLVWIILLLPVWIIMPIIIKKDSKGGAIFKQKRLGLNGREFNIFKYRTMVENAERIGDGIYLKKGDDRVTKVGKKLRSASLDELPQLFNILFGTMSFIGPRPPATFHPHKIEDYTDFKRQRFYVKPGMSGLAQIKLRDSYSWDDKIELDVEYVYSRSLFYDAKMLIKTVTSLKKGDAF